MKYKVIAILDEGGVVICNKNIIMCFDESSIADNDGKNPLNAEINMILTDKNLVWADKYWEYTTKEWNEMNKRFAAHRLDV